MKTGKLLSILIALVMLVTLFVGCSNTDEESDSKNKGDKEQTEQVEAAEEETDEEETDEEETDEEETDEEETDEEETDEEDEENEEIEQTLEGLNLKKVGSFTKDNATVYSAGVVYKEGDKYGIITPDGTKSTGAIYTYCKPVGSYFMVTDYDLRNTTPDNLNIVGVVDAEGDVIVPMKYAVVDEINDRYIKACTATEITNNKDEALIYSSDKMFSVIPSEGDVFYKGKWVVYDTTTGKKVPGAEGTKAYYIMGYGDILSYHTDDGDTVYSYPNGKKLDAKASVFINGSYKIDSKTGGKVYNSDGKELFSYDSTDYKPSSSVDKYLLNEDFFVGLKYNSDTSTYLYALMNQNGDIIIDELPSSDFIMFGDIIMSPDGTLIDVDGNVVFDEEMNSLFFDETFFDYFIIVGKKEYIIIDENGIEYSRIPKTDSIDINGDTIRKKDGYDNYFYSFKDKDFTVKGKLIDGSIRLVTVKSDNNTQTLVDLVSGKELLKAYSSYDMKTNSKGTFIYACGTDGSYDVYMVK